MKSSLDSEDVYDYITHLPGYWVPVVITPTPALMIYKYHQDLDH